MLPSILFAALLLAGPAAFSSTPPYAADEIEHDFGRVAVGAPLEHTFALRNTGATPLRISKVHLTPPWIVTRMKSAIAPGEEASIVVTPARQMPAGPFEGDIIVHFEDESIEPLLLRVRGTLVPELEFDPMPAFFVATTRGRPAEVSIELINHGAEPLAPPTVEVTGDRFAARLDVLQPGRRFRITVAMSGKGAAGRETGDLVLTTSNALQSRIRLQVNTLLRERVYAFPAEIDLGAISLARLAADPAEADRRAQQLMVYQVGGRDFRIEVSTDLSFVRLGAEKSTTFTDRWQISVAIDPSKVTAWHGPGTITIHTNDAEFPVLTVPVQGSVE